MHRFCLSGLIFVLSLALAPARARADWIDLGAAYKCDQGRRALIVKGTVDTSSPELPGTIRAEQDFIPISGKQLVECRFKGSRIKVAVNVFGPQAQGACLGGGTVIIGRVLANGVSVQEAPEAFNSACISPSMISLSVAILKTHVAVETCSGEWDWERGYFNVVCIQTMRTNRSIERTASSGASPASSRR
jgi:hypothetical protein